MKVHFGNITDLFHDTHIMIKRRLAIVQVVF